MKLKYLLAISLAVLLSACNNPSNSVPIQSDSDEYQNQYQNTPPLTNTEALTVGAVGVATGYAVGKHYYQTKPKVSVSRHYKRK